MTKYRLNSKEIYRFWKKVKKKDGCWSWNGKPNTTGYSRFYARGFNLAAHRIMYELVVGKIPKGLSVDHLCRNRSCVNPKHLEPVTGRENVLRGISIIAKNARRTHCPSGHKYSKENLVITKQGWRRCRKCRNFHMQNYRVRNKI